MPVTDLELRALMPDDAGAARALVSGQFAGTIYQARLDEQLDAALTFEDAEYMAVLAFDPSPSAPRGVVLFGAVAGARKVVKVHALVGQSAAVLETLLGAVRQVAQGSRERMVLCELPEDALFDQAAAALIASGYVEEGRVPHMVRDGVGMRMLVWREESAG